MINILPQPRKMFEFVARLRYFRITTSSCDFLAQNRELILQILREMEMSISPEIKIWL